MCKNSSINFHHCSQSWVWQCPCTRIFTNLGNLCVFLQQNRYQTAHKISVFIRTFLYRMLFIAYPTRFCSLRSSSSAFFTTEMIICCSDSVNGWGFGYVLNWLVLTDHPVRNLVGKELISFLIPFILKVLKKANSKMLDIFMCEVLFGIRKDTRTWLLEQVVCHLDTPMAFWVLVVQNPTFY